MTTSASSGPLGSAASPVTLFPSSVVTPGSGCSPGAGNAWVMTSSSSARPTPCGLEVVSTGKKLPRATAFSRSSISTLGSMSSPPPSRYRSIRDSSSLSWMIPSISALRSSDVRPACSASGSRSVRVPLE